MNRMKVFAIIVFAVIVGFATIGPVKADSAVTWALNDVVFASGQTAIGSFTLQNGNLTNWDIRIIGGTNPVLTNVAFKPGGSCVAFCGEAFDTTTPFPTQSGIDVRTSLAPDNTFFEFSLYFDNETIAQLSSPNAPITGVDTASYIGEELLLNPTTVTGAVPSDELSSSAMNASIIPTPEPATVALFSMTFAIFVLFPVVRRFGPEGRVPGQLQRTCG